LLFLAPEKKKRVFSSENRQVYSLFFRAFSKN